LNGTTETLLGINEIVVSRQRLQAAKLGIRLGERRNAYQLTGDGMLISTPIGSTGYNRSAGGPTLMLESRLLTVTGLAVCQPTNWSSIVIEDRIRIEIEVLDPTYRPVRMETIGREVSEVGSVRVSLRKDKKLTLLLEDDRY
jgi:NAD+ kinase